MPSSKDTNCGPKGHLSKTETNEEKASEFVVRKRSLRKKKIRIGGTQKEERYGKVDVREHREEKRQQRGRNRERERQRLIER